MTKAGESRKEFSHNSKELQADFRSRSLQNGVLCSIYVNDGIVLFWGSNMVLVAVTVIM